MAVLLFRLTHVPEDEAQDIRDLLSEHDIYFYETNAGFWRVGLDAIWLTDQSQAEQARELIKAYQADRNIQQKENYARLVEQGEAVSFAQQLRAHPIRFVGAVLAITFVLALSFSPFIFFWHSTAK